MKKIKKSESVTRSQPFTATVVEGNGPWHHKLKITSTEFYQNQLNKFKPGTKVTLEIHTSKPKRTDQQNRYYWGVYLPIIAEETGNNNLIALHELFKSLFLTTKIIEVLGRKVRIKKSTTELGVGDFCQYIINIEGETEVIAPPTENWDLAPLRSDPKPY